MKVPWYLATLRWRWKILRNIPCITSLLICSILASWRLTRTIQVLSEFLVALPEDEMCLG